MPKQTQWLLAALGAVGVLYLYSLTQSGQSTVSSISDYLGNLLTARGIRNNNPGNIRRSSIEWQGALTPDQVAAAGLTWDPDFVQFDSPANGVRAIGHILLSYSRRGLTTVDTIIPEWSQTDQGAYVADVAGALGVAPSDVIDVQGELPNLAAAIIEQENGSQPYAINDLSAWVYS